MHECAVVTVAQRLLIAAAAATLVSSQLLPAVAAQIGLPGCPTSCGNVSVPYPFGISPGCYMEGFNLTCDRSSSPPRLLLGNGTLQVVVDVSLHNSTVRVLSPTIQLEFKGEWEHGYAGSEGYGTWGGPGWGLGDGSPYSLLESYNEFILWGCFFFGELWLAGGGRAPVPIGRASYDVRLNSIRNLSHIADPAATPPYAVLIAEEGRFDQNKITEALPIPMVLSWDVPSSTLQGRNKTRDGNATCPADLGTPPYVIVVTARAQASTVKTRTTTAPANAGMGTMATLTFPKDAKMWMNEHFRINAMALVQIYLATIYANAHTEPGDPHIKH
ncbi:hypothetical protein BAE44_0016179 [Dichanthelium oligosanthes]|uniref:Wall-associated receptor kinase galacturonan-binding domain-containing protein n=1 Tax=Dichanthelium oligosanthes TaxID=888268 RepID=A0A1E5VCC1_9POAL|nr:hypothetical protein BAE44_0016179 [Dichanthelium oligosanthes]